MIYKFGGLYLMAGTIISVTLILSGLPFFGFCLGVYMLASISMRRGN